MKRITLIFVVIIAILSATVLGACGGSKMSEEEWNEAMDFQNCDAITISYKQEKSANARITKTYNTHTVTYDKANGMLYSVQEIKTYNIFDVLTEQIDSYQFVEVTGEEVKNYTKTDKDNRPSSWSANFRSYGDEDMALEQLSKVFQSYLATFGLDSFSYSGFTLKKGKYVKTAVINDKNTLWQLNFSDGKLSSASFETKHKLNSSNIDYEKVTVTLTYSADIQKPDNLPLYG